MDFLKKNVMWIALAGLAVAVYVMYRMNEAIVKKEDGSYALKGQDSTSGFGGKVRNNNPVA